MRSWILFSLCREVSSCAMEALCLGVGPTALFTPGQWEGQGQTLAGAQSLPVPRGDALLSVSRTTAVQCEGRLGVGTGGDGKSDSLLALAGDPPIAISAFCASVENPHPPRDPGLSPGTSASCLPSPQTKHQVEPGTPATPTPAYLVVCLLTAKLQAFINTPSTAQTASSRPPPNPPGGPPRQLCGGFRLQKCLCCLCQFTGQ